MRAMGPLLLAVAACGRIGFAAGDGPPGPFDPSNGIPPGLLDGVTGTLDGPGPGMITINTDTGEVKHDGVVIRAAGTGVIAGVRFDTLGSLGMFGVTSWMVGAVVTVRGFGTRSLVVLSEGDVIVNGEIDASAGWCLDATLDPSCGGPGGGEGGTLPPAPLPATGCGPGGNGDGGNNTGGGGGGMGEPGGDGGGVPPGAGGTIAGCSSVALVPLAGGSGGGAETTAQGAGGGGGGAIQISAFGLLRIQGFGISAGGGGGRGGGSQGAGGGGSGGAILLEAPVIDLVAGTLAANGGGGGEGNDAGPGGFGDLNDVPAAGGFTGTGNRGGQGGARGMPPTAGSGLTDAGGGGGGVGRIRVNASTTMKAGIFITSPAETTGSL